MSTQLGDIAEISFMLRAMKAGFNVCSPYSKDSAYDCILDYKGKLNRIQIKATGVLNKGRSKGASEYYRLVCSHGSTGKKLYTKNECDYFALYVMPLDQFFIVPVTDIKTKTFKIYPNNFQHKHYKYLERFDLLK